MSLMPFHLAFPVHDLELARAFYGGTLGCATGRESATWIDFDFFGHQISAHLSPELRPGLHNPVDGDQVPVPHFGVVLDMSAWHALKERLLERDDLHWVIEPRIRFEGEVGEQATLFVLDPSGNALEFKGFSDRDQIFATSADAFNC